MAIIVTTKYPKELFFSFVQRLISIKENTWGIVNGTNTDITMLHSSLAFMCVYEHRFTTDKLYLLLYGLKIENVPIDYYNSYNSLMVNTLKEHLADRFQEIETTPVALTEDELDQLDFLH